MAEDFRALLDQMMGKDRDVPLDQRVVRRPKYSDPEVCKHALAGLCPFGLFPNTKSDLGPCEFEIHEDHLEWEGIQGEYTALSEREKDRLGYERGLLRLLSRLVSDMDRKIEKAQERATLESMPKPLKPEQQAEVDALRAQAKELTERSEKLAEAGDVDASLAAVQQAERLRGDADRLASRYSQPDRFMIVCEVCGLFIQSTDNEARRRDHIEGKQYLGWLAIRNKHQELAEKYSGAGPRPETEEGEVGEAPPPRSRSRDGPDRDRRRRSRSRSRDRRRYDERDRRYDERDRPRGRDYDDRRRYDDRRGSRGGYGAVPPPGAYRGRDRY